MAQANGVITHRGAKVLFKQRRGREHLCVRERDGLRWLHFDQHDVQTLIDLQQPDRLVPPYATAMLAALLFQPSPGTLLNLGIGGGSFERFFYRHLPNLKITSVDTDSTVVSLARRYFQFPTAQQVTIDCAERFVLRHPQRYDLIFCDIHMGKRHPAFLFSPAFLGNLKNRLNANGVAAINLLPGNYDELLKAVIALRESFLHVWLVDVTERRNLVLLCFNHPPPGQDLRRAHAERLSSQLQTKLTPLLPVLSEIGRPQQPLASMPTEELPTP